MSLPPDSNSDYAPDILVNLNSLEDPKVLFQADSSEQSFPSPKAEIVTKTEPSTALASLTATYTDSDADSSVDVPEELEEKDESEKEIKTDEPKKEDSEASLPIHSPLSPADSSPHSDSSSEVENPFPENRHVPSRLVSYATEGDDKEEDDDVDFARDGDSSGEITSFNMTYDNDSDSSEESDTTEGFIHVHSSVDIKLPPEPSGRCSNQLQEKISKYFEKKLKNGLDMNELIQKRKDFRNPSIYEKLIDLCEIDQIGSNYPREIYDPHSWKPTSFYEELAKVQKTEMDKREKEKKERTKVEFVSGTVKKSTEPAEDIKKRKTKWDVASTQPSTLPVMKHLIVTAASNQPVISVSTSASGTRTTIIPAVGNLAKKPRQ